MHLVGLEGALGAAADQAVDLGQTPGDLVVLSAADSELACLAAARHRLPADFPSLRLANLASLSHPLSVDLHVERVVAQAKLVVVRLLGGRSYWPYGIEQVAALGRLPGGPLLALLAGDARPDPELTHLSTLPAEALAGLQACFTEGGVENAEQALRRMATLAGGTWPWREAAPLPRAGLYRETQGAAGPPAWIVFYRALVQAGDTAPIDALMAVLSARGVAARAFYAASLREPEAAAVLAAAAAKERPGLVLNLTGFALTGAADPLAALDVPVVQAVLAGQPRDAWASSTRGLTPQDLAMNVALTELDGRVLARAVSFKEAAAWDPLTEIRLARHAPVPDRVAFVADLASAWRHLSATPSAHRRVGLVLANYPARAGRMANGVGLDTPESAMVVLAALPAAGYALEDVPETAAALLAGLAEGPTNAAPTGGTVVRARLPLEDYRAFLGTLPAAAQAELDARWGDPAADPFVRDDAFALPFLPLGNVVIGLQPVRGHGLDPDLTAHDPLLPPPHAYLAFYAWLRRAFGAQAVIHLGKHGNLEWLPGKALALSADCWPELALGPLPQLYPFIVNDPGEATQAKRRTSAVILGHLTPPLAQAGPSASTESLERLLDELAAASGLDPKRAVKLMAAVEAEADRLGVAADLDLAGLATPARLTALDRHLCELKGLQIRDGLHVYGRTPSGPQRAGLLAALARLPRGTGEGGDASLVAAIAADLGLDLDIPAADPATPWVARLPNALHRADNGPCRLVGQVVERLDRLALALVAGEVTPDPAWQASIAVLEVVRDRLAPMLHRSAAAELANLLGGLDGRFVPPGPGAAPTRGRHDVLPTGRNLFSLDTRAVPTPTAWRTGSATAAAVLAAYTERHGAWPQRLALVVWGTATMRTGGDEVAQALALMGCKPRWDPATGRVLGVEVVPAGVLGRPRVDVTLRVSGFFRDAFPAQLDLIDDAVRAVAALDEAADQNPLADTVRREVTALAASGLSPAAAGALAGARLFSAPPGAYGTGLQALVDEGAWQQPEDIAKAFLAWGGHAYGRGLDGRPAPAQFAARLRETDVVLQSQDNREHDILDSDDYWQFEGGLAAAARHLSGRTPEIFHADTSVPDRPRVRPLAEEIGLVVRGRAANAKWIAGVMRHGYKGAFEIAATVDYLTAFAATTGLVADHHFQQLYDAYLGNPAVVDFMAEANPAALAEIRDRFREALTRGLWRPRSNSVAAELASAGSIGAA